MSTFAVFGMTEHFACEEARKKTLTSVGKTQLTEAQWLEAVERRVEQVMAGARVAQLSALFDAPQFAEQFIALLRKSGKARDLKIRAEDQSQAEDRDSGRAEEPDRKDHGQEGRAQDQIDSADRLRGWFAHDLCQAEVEV